MKKIYLLKWKKINLVINVLGAEVREFCLDNFNYIHSDFSYWQNTSPHLFPIVGRVKDGKFLINENSYSINGHGFVRDNEFVITNETRKSVTLLLQDNEASLKSYPFHFTYSVKYQLINNGLVTKIRVKNSDSREIVFNIGEHPGFRLVSNIANYKLCFERKENFASPIITSEKLLDFTTNPQQYRNVKVLNLSEKMFENDAVINNCVRSQKVRLVSKDYTLDYYFKPFQTFAIWKKPGASFICLEPWNGYADTIDASGNLLDKPQLIRLKPNKKVTFKTKFIIRRKTC